MSIPPDLTNLLAVAVRDVLWYKDSVLSYLRDCGIPKRLLGEVREKNDAKEPTIKIVRFVLDDLAEQGEDGRKIAKKMLTTMYYWNDLHTVPPERLAKAVESLKALREGYKRYEAQVNFQREQETKMHAARVERGQISSLDHARLQAFRDEFDSTHAMSNPNERGNRFQDLMNRIFKYYCEDSKGDFNRDGEQIDGLFYFEKHWWYVEVRWRKEKAKAADISVLRDRARGAFGGDTKALFISFNGFSDECLRSTSGRADERVILMDGFDLRCVLDCQIGFDVLLAAKQAYVVQEARSFVGAAEIIAKRH